jgi:hypothetical protein
MYFEEASVSAPFASWSLGAPQIDDAAAMTSPAYCKNFKHGPDRVAFLPSLEPPATGYCSQRIFGACLEERLGAECTVSPQATGLGAG